MANLKPKLKTEIQTLQDDASRIVLDMESLSRTVGDLGKEKSQQVIDDVTEKTEKELALLRSRMREIEQLGRAYRKELDTHVRQNPYAYIVGFLGLGVILGKLLAPRNY